MDGWQYLKRRPGFFYRLRILFLFEDIREILKNYKILKICSSKSGKLYREITLPGIASSICSSPSGSDVYVCCESSSSVFMYVLDPNVSAREEEMSSQGSQISVDSPFTPSPLLRNSSRAVLEEEEALKELEMSGNPKFEDPDVSFGLIDTQVGEEGLSCCSVSKDGHLVAACCPDNRQILVWGAASQRLLTTIKPDLKIENGAGDREGMIINGDMNQNAQDLPGGSPGWIELYCANAETWLLGAAWIADGSVLVYDLNELTEGFGVDKKVVRRLREKHDGVCVCPKFLAEDVIVTVSTREIRLWKLPAEDSLSETKPYCTINSVGRALPQSVQVACGRYVFLGCADYGIYVYDVSAQIGSELTRVLRSHSGAVTSLSLSVEDKPSLLSCGSENSVARWRLSEATKDCTNRSNKVEKLDCFWDQEGTLRTACIDSQGNLKIVSGNCTRDDADGMDTSENMEFEGIRDVCFTPTGSLIMSCADGSIVAFNLEALGQYKHEVLYKSGGSNQWNLIQSQSGNIICAWNSDGNLRVATVDSSKKISWRTFKIKESSLPVLHCCVAEWTHRVWRVIVGTNSGIIEVYDPINNCWTFYNEQQGFPVLCMDTYSHLIVAGFQRCLKMWEVSSSSSVSIWTANAENHKDCVRMCKFSPSGHFLAIGDDTGNLCLYELPARSQKARKFTLTFQWKVVNAHSAYITHLAFSPCETQLISAGRDLKFWSVGDFGRPLGSVPFGGDAVKKVCFHGLFSTVVVLDSYGKLHWLISVVM